MRCLLVSVMFLGMAANAADCPLDLGEVLSEYVEARGGAEALNGQHALRMISNHYEGEYQPRFDFRVMKPGYMRIEATYRDGYVYTEGFDGERGWEKPDGKNAEYVAGAAGTGLNQAAMSPVYLYGLNHMASLGAEVTLNGCETVEDDDYYVIRVVAEFGSDISYFVNADNFRLERGRTVRPLHPTQDPTPITLEERWHDFRLIDGVLHPFGYRQVNLDTGEQLSRMEMLEIVPLPDATPADFAKPD